MAIKVGTFDSMNEFEASLKGNAGFIRFIGDEPLVVRFLTEPDEWVKYTSHFDAENKMGFPCDDSSCVGCMEGMNTSTRYLSNALLTDEQRVVPLQLPITLATILTRRYKKYGTLLDRDYELSKDGEGLKTKYDATPEPAQQLKLSRYEKLELVEILQDSMDEYNTIAGIANGTAVNKNKTKPGRSKAETLDDDEEDEDEQPARRTGGVARKRVGGPGRKRPGVKPRASKPVDDTDDDEDEAPARTTRVAGRAKAAASTRPTSRVKAKPEPEPEDDDDDESSSNESIDDLMHLGLRALKNILKTEFEWSPADYKGMDIDELAQAIVEARTESGDDAEVDDETGTDSEDEDADDDAVDEDDDEDADGSDDEDGEYYTEEDLQAMSFAEVKTLAKESGITVKRSMGKDDVIAALLDEEDDNEPPF